MAVRSVPIPGSKDYGTNLENRAGSEDCRHIGHGWTPLDLHLGSKPRILFEELLHLLLGTLYCPAPLDDHSLPRL